MVTEFITNSLIKKKYNVIILISKILGTLIFCNIIFFVKTEHVRVGALCSNNLEIFYNMQSKMM